MIYVSADGRTCEFNGSQLDGLYRPGTRPLADDRNTFARVLGPIQPLDQCCKDCRRRFKITQQAARCVHWAVNGRHGIEIHGGQEVAS